MNSRNLPIEPSSDSPVVFQGTQQGHTIARIEGRSYKRSQSALVDGLSRFLTLPGNILGLALDAVLWTFSASSIVSVIELIPEAAWFLGFPFSALLLGLVVITFYSGSLRIPAAIRLGLLVFGIVLAI